MSTKPASPPVNQSRPSLLARFKAVYARHETIRFLTESNLKAGHRDKVLGHLWSLLDPLLFAAVYFVVFGLLFAQARGQSTSFLIYLVIGVFAWRFMDGAVMQAASCIRGRRGLIHEISFPKAIFPISICLSRLYDFMWGQIALLAILLIAGVGISFHVVWVPVVIVLQLLFVLGLSFIVAYLGAFFADTVNVVAVAMRLWFYSSPLFYYVTSEHGGNGIIPERVMFYFMLNPIACFFEVYRDCLLYHEAPDGFHLAYVAVISVTTLFVGFAVFARGEGSFAKYI